MHTWIWKGAVLAALGACALVAVPTPAAESPLPAKIAKLIEQMSTGKADEQVKAADELIEIGEPALKALKDTAKITDPGAKARAAQVASRIESRLGSAKLIAPSKVNLSYKDTPVAEAVADFAKKTGSNIALHDPKGVLKSRTVTLETGDTTFWQAFDMFCEKAGLTEATPQDLFQGRPVPIEIQPGPPIRIQPVPPGGIRPLPADRAVPPQPPVERKDQPDRNGRNNPFFLADEPQAEPPVQIKPAVRPAIALPAQVQPGAPPAVAPQPVPRPLPPRPVVQQPGQILLVDGKPAARPTDYSSAVRVRAAAENTFGRIDNRLTFTLQLTPEPKLNLQYASGVKITKAKDDQDQDLTQALTAMDEPLPVPGGTAPGFPGGNPGLPIKGIPPPVDGGGFGGVPFGYAAGPGMLVAPVMFKKAAKPTKELKEVAGYVTAQLVPEAKALITTDDVLKSAGKTVKGADGGSITIIEATKGDNGAVKVRFQLEATPGFVPGGDGGVIGGGGFTVPGGGGAIEIQPGVIQPGVIRPVPPIREVPPQVDPLPPGAFQVGEAQPAQAAPVARPAIQLQPAQIQIAPAQPVEGGALLIAPGRPGMGFGTGVTVVDDKGNKIAATVTQQLIKNPQNNRLERQMVAAFQLPKGVETAKLVFSGSKPVTVEIPFKLTNVPVQ